MGQGGAREGRDDEELRDVGLGQASRRQGEEGGAHGLRALPRDGREEEARQAGGEEDGRQEVGSRTRASTASTRQRALRGVMGNETTPDGKPHDGKNRTH